MRQSYRVAMGGLICALAVLLMFTTGFIPIGTYLLPAMAGALLLVIALEFGLPWAYLVYIGVSLLCLLVTPDREAAMLFLTFFGHYPTTKLLLERMHPRWLVVLCKLALFNLTMIANFWLMIALFGYADILEQFGMFGTYGPWVFLAICNPVFVMLDLCLTRLKELYLTTFRPRVLKKH